MTKIIRDFFQNPGRFLKIRDVFQNPGRFFKIRNFFQNPGRFFKIRDFFQNPGLFQNPGPASKKYGGASAEKIWGQTYMKLY